MQNSKELSGKYMPTVGLHPFTFDMMWFVFRVTDNYCTWVKIF